VLHYEPIVLLFVWLFHGIVDTRGDSFLALYCVSYLNKMKISFDYDGTASTPSGRRLLKRKLAKRGNKVYIISARRDKKQMVKRLSDLSSRLTINHILAVGSNSKKVQKVRTLGIQQHYDNRADVTRALGPLGKLFKA
jgi:hypothetical protein